MKPTFFLLVIVVLLALTACTPAAETAISPLLEDAVPTPTVAPPTPLVAAPSPTALPLGTAPAVDKELFTLAGQLGGSANAIDLEGDTAYVGIGARLVTVDISDLSAPRFLGQSDVLPGLAEALALQGGRAYVSAGGNLYIYDVREPAAPVKFGAINLLADPDRVSRAHISLAGMQVYIQYRLDSPRGSILIAVDVSDPAQPVIVDRRDLAVTAGVTISGGVLYIANEGKLRLVEATEPGNTLGEIVLEFKLSSHYWRYFVAVVGDLAYLGVTQQPLQVWDVRDPSHPVRIPAGQVVLPPSEIEMEAAGDVLILVDMSNADCNFIIRVIDITEAASLRYRAESNQFNCITAIATAGDGLVASTEGGLQVFDLSNPAGLPVVGSFVHPVGFDAVYNVALNHDLAYIILGHGEDTRLAVLDRTQAAAPVMVGEPLSLPVMPGSGVDRLFVRGERIYVKPGVGSMLALDISQPASPRLIPYEDDMIGDWLFVPALRGDLLYSRVGSELVIVDFSDPANPAIRSTVSTWPEGLCDLSMAGGYLVAASCAGAEKVLYDLSDPLQPVVVGRLVLPDQFGPYAVAGDTFYYASTDAHNLIAIDLSDPSNPVEISRLALPAYTYEMLPSGDNLYLMMAERLWAVNLSVRAHPYLETSLPLRVGDFDIDGDLLYLAAYDAGLVIVRVGR